MCNPVAWLLARAVRLLIPKSELQYDENDVIA